MWTLEPGTDPVCQIDPGEPLQLWVSSAPEIDAEIEVRLLDQTLTASDGEAVQNGFLFRLEAPARDATVRVEARRGRARARWSLVLEPRPEWSRELRRLATTSPGALEERLAEAAPAARAESLSWLARFDLYAGDTESAFERLDAAIALHRQVGALSQSLDDALVKVHWSLEVDDFAAARTQLSTLPALPSSLGREHYQIDYYLGLLAADTGDPRTALKHLWDAAEQAERLGLEVERVQVEQLLGWQWQWLGRWDEALDLYARLEREGPRVLEDPCELAALYNNLGWRRLLAAEAGRATADPVPELLRALELLHQGDCPPGNFEAENVRTNLALAHLQRGRLEEARTELHRAQATSAEPPLLYRMWWRDLEARLAFAAGRLDDTLEIYRQVERLAADALDLDAAWRAAIGRAQVFAARGISDRALAAFERAEELLDRAVSQVPINAGRESFVAPRARGTRLFLDFLLHLERFDEAFELARRARLRGLRSLLQPDLERLTPEQQQRWDRLRARLSVLRQQIDRLAAEAWQVPGDRAPLRRAELEDLHQQLARTVDELNQILETSSAIDAGVRPASLADDELVLLYHPLSEGWAGFARHRGMLTVRRLGELDPEAAPEQLARTLLEPFSPQLERASTVRVLTLAALQSIDFHALPVAGEPLIARKAVIYGLDAAASEPSTSQAPPGVLMVADPNGDLPSARAETESIERLLASWRPRPAVLSLIGEAARPDRLRREIERAHRFHYAGHGVFTGWQSALPLAADGSLTVNDILALERVPAHVVLSGCQTGRTAVDGEGAGIAGLAQAFLTRGTRSVTAAVRPVDDADAARLMQHYYAALGDRIPESRALQIAQSALRREVSGADWSSFRLFER